MDDPRSDEKPRRRYSAPVRQLVANASDEQLAWMVGPDRDFYSREALSAATEELEKRREERGDLPEPRPFEVGAFALGPLWYFYHGMVGRGLLILFVLVGALFGLEPIADALDIPSTLFVLVVLMLIGAYCGRFGARDLAESELQARLAARKVKPRPESPPPPTAGQEHMVAAVVGCAEAASQARELLAAEGIESSVRAGEGPSPRLGVVVHRDNLEQARELLAELLSVLENDPSSLCAPQE